MIQSKKTFFKIIKCDPRRIKVILDNLDMFYYEKKEVKKNADGTPKRDSKGNIKYRVLYPSKGELKGIQHKIKNRILSQIKLPECAFGGVRKRDNILNARCHKGKKYKFVTDLDKFFPSVKPFQVYDSLIAEDFSPDIASMLTKLVTYKNHIPQGAPTSTHISNLVLKEIDLEIIEICKTLNITYSRFVDDLAFSSPIDFKSKTVILISPMVKNGFNISHRKTKYGIGAIEITGVWVRNNELDVSDTMKIKLANPQLFTANQNRGNSTYTNRVHSM